MIFWGYSIYGWGRYFFFDYTNTERILVDLTRPVDTAAPKINIKNLLLKEVKVFDAGNDKYDFAVRVHNPNAKWKAEVRYRFLYSGQVSDVFSGFVLPGNEQVLANLGEELLRYPTGIGVEIVDVNWKRIDPHKVRNPLEFIDGRVIFDVDEVVFTPANFSRGIVIHTIEFDVHNNSVYSYWSPEFYVFYLNNQTPVGIKKIQIDKFRSGESSFIELKSLANNLRVTGVEIVPSIDVFDENVFIEPGL